jgi:pimeloyl-ACP methyl ester carboxylesterase
MSLHFFASSARHNAAHAHDDAPAEADSSTKVMSSGATVHEPTSSESTDLSRRNTLRLVAGGGALATTSLLGLSGASGAAAATTSAGGGAPAAVDGVLLAPATKAITPFKVQIPACAITDVKYRLKTARLPERETVTDWSQGAPLDRMTALIKYWSTRYDWRRLEKRLNAYPQFRTEIDGLGIHFLHVRSKHAEALPIVLSHGWPGSVVEFLDAIGPLTDPTRYGGKASDAFHVVIPSLPGFGFSDKPTGRWNVAQTAKAWATLMQRLGYTRYVAQGGDWGSAVTHALAELAPQGLAGIHTNFPTFLFDPPISSTPDAEEQKAIAQITEFVTTGNAYLLEETTRPQTIGYALADSPTGQAAWIYEKFGFWTDSDFHPEAEIGIDRMLDAISLYWLTNTAASSGRIYWENPKTVRKVLDLPVAVSVFPAEIISAPRVWAQKTYTDLVYFNHAARGGHFAAFEQPDVFAQELRAGFKAMR